MPRNDSIQVRRDTAANWTSVNPTLASGEIGFETDTGKFKIGTGSTAWTSLLYATDASDVTGTFPSLAVAGDVTVDTSTFKVDATNNRVGIGTSSPNRTLDVIGTVRATASDTQDGIVLQGRVGGTSNYAVTLTPTTLTSSQTLTLPDTTGTVAVNEALFKTSADLSGAAAYYRPLGVPFAFTLVTNNSTALGFGISSPYIFETKVVISEIGFRTGGTVSATNIKFVIYKTGLDNTAPTTKVYESSDVAISTINTVVSLTGLSVSLTAGMYWIFIYNTTTGNMSLTVNATNLSGSANFSPFTSMTNALNQANTGGGWSINTGTATPPSTLLPFGTGSTATSTDSNWPRIAIRRSA